MSGEKGKNGGADETQPRVYGVEVGKFSAYETLNLGLILTFNCIFFCIPESSILINTRLYSPINPGPGCQEKIPFSLSKVEPIGRGLS